MEKHLLKLTLLFLASFFCFNANSQAPDWQWAKSFGGPTSEYLGTLATDSLGNVYTVGSFDAIVDFDPNPGSFNLSPAGLHDIFISKLDSAGNFLWAKKIGGSQEDYATQIIIDSVNNMYVAGSFGGTVDFDPGSGVANLTVNGSINTTDAFILKLDSAANFMWVKQIAGTFSDKSIFSIHLDAGGNIYATGYFSGSVDFDPGAGVFNLTAAGNMSYHDGFIFKLNSLGNFVWAKKIGSTSEDVVEKILTDDAGNIYATGIFSGTVDLNPNAGVFNLTAVGNSDVFLTKLDSSGNFIWANRIGSGGYEYIKSIAIDKSNNIYAAGVFSNTIDFDPGPGVFNLTAPGFPGDAYILKLDSAGNFIWAQKIGGVDIEDMNVVFIAKDDSKYFTGSFIGTVDFDPGVGAFNLISPVEQSIFILKLDSADNFSWAKAAQSSGNLYGVQSNTLTVDNVGSMYVAGFFDNAILTIGSTILTNNGAPYRDVFIAKLGNIITGIKNVEHTSDVSLYPNPTSDYLVINLNTIPQKADVTITDISGKIIYKNTFPGIQKLEVTTKYFPAGMYFCVVNIDGKSSTKKIIRN